MKDKLKVILRAPVLSASGYGNHARQIARWLLSRNDIDLYIYVVQWGITPWYLNRDSHGGLISEMMDKTKPVKGKADVSFQVQLPNEWDNTLAHINVGVTAGVETDRCNPEWIKSVNSMDRVIVPSKHTLATFERSGHLTTPMSVVHEAFIDSILEDDLPELDLGIDTSFNFLTVGQMTGNDDKTDRKNMFKTIKWFCEAFSKDEDVGLILKTNNGRESKIDRQLTHEAIQRTLTRVRKGPYPKIHFLHGRLSEREIASLYCHSKVKAFLSLTRGEGFGLPLLEAAASGLPIIATNWSGHLDFLNRGKFIKVDYELEPIHQSRVDNKIFMPGVRWAEARESDVKRKLKKFRDNHEIPIQWASDLKETLKKEFSLESLMPKYDDVLSGLNAGSKRLTSDVFDLSALGLSGIKND